MVHRILPELVNLGANLNQSNELPLYPAPGKVLVTIEGSNSVGSTASQITPVLLSVDANGNTGNNPWAQIDQNAFRVNSLILSDISTSTIWHCSNMTWQISKTEEDR